MPLYAPSKIHFSFTSESAGGGQSALFRLYENAFSSTSKCLLFRTQKKIASYGRESSLLAASKLFFPDENNLFEREIISKTG